MIGRLALLAFGLTFAGVWLTSEELITVGGALSAGTVIAWVLKVWPHNHWRGFRRHRF